MRVMNAMCLGDIAGSSVRNVFNSLIYSICTEYLQCTYGPCPYDLIIKGHMINHQCLLNINNVFVVPVLTILQSRGT